MSQLPHGSLLKIDIRNSPHYSKVKVGHGYEEKLSTRVARGFVDT